MIKAYKFGLLNPISGFDQAAMDVLYLRNKLWNQLVELEKNSRAAYRALMLDSSEELSVIQTRIDAIEVERADLVSQKKKLRASVRSKKVDTAGIDAAVERLIAERTNLRAKAKQLREVVKVEIKPKAVELDKVRYAAVLALIKGSGLWWGNSETVIAAYDVARVRAMKESAELRFRSFDGTGKFAYRESGGIDFDKFMSGKVNFARLNTLPDSDFAHLSERGRRSKARHHLTMTVLTSVDDAGKKVRHEVTWPIVMHRDMPAGAIKTIHVHRKRVGDQFNWTCSITIDVPEEPKQLIDHPAKAACGIDLGFRLVKDGLRIATIADSDNRIEHVVLPLDWIEKMDYVEHLQSTLSETANLTWVRLRKHLSELPDYPESIKERIHNILKAGERVPTRGMRSLLGALKAEPELLPEALQILAAWSDDIYRPAREMHNLRDKLMKRRQDLYRNVSHCLSNKYAMVRVEDMDLRQIARVKKDDGSDNPLPDTVRDNRKRAALFEFVLSIKQSCVKTGSVFEKMNPAYSSMTCSSCGHLNQPGMDIHYSCENCGTLHDQDENAAKNFLRGEYFSSPKQDVA